MALGDTVAGSAASVTGVVSESAGDERGDLDGDGGAGEVVEGADGGAAEDDGELGVLEGEADLVGEAEALGDGGGLGGVPGGRWAWGPSESLGGVRVGGDDVDAVAAVGGVEDEAGGGMGVVGDLGALVGGEGERLGRCRGWR